MGDKTVLRSWVCCLVLLWPSNVATQEEGSPLPTITQFTIGQDVTGIATTATAAFGDTPILRCSAHSAVAPLSMSIMRERSGATLLEEDTSDLTLSLDPLVCEDTDVFVCHVKNPEGEKMAKLELSVPCSPQLLSHNLPTDLDSPFYNGSVGHDVTVHLEVLATPPPRLVSLTRSNSEDVLAHSSLVRRAEEVDREQGRYDIKFLSSTAPYGSVELTMRNLTTADTMKIFTLVVDNGQVEKLNYVFMVKCCEGSGIQPIHITPSTAPSVDPLPPRNPLNIPALALGVALSLVVLVVVVGVVGWIVYNRCDRKGGKVEAMTHKLEFRKRKKRSFVNSDECAVPPPGASTSVVIDYSARPRNLTLHVRELQQRNIRQQQEQQQQQQQKHQKQQEKLQQSLDDDENFSKDFQPQDRLSRSHDPTSPSVENPYYVSGFDPMGTVMEKDGLGTGVASGSSENETMETEEGDGRSQLQQLDAAVARDANTGEGNAEIETSDVSRAKQTSPRKPEITVSLATRADEAAGGSDSCGSPRSPEDIMKAAELKIANGSFEKDFVVPGQHRKLSLPKDDLGVYEF